MFEALISRFIETVADQTLASLLGDDRQVEWELPEIGAVLTPDALQGAVSNHLDRVAGWASDIHFYKMPEPEPTDEITLPLDLTRTIRRFRPRDEGSGSAPPDRDLSERELLSSSGHYLLLGDPGAGKTTTMKRLVGRLLHEPEDAGDIWEIPIVAVLREHGNDTSICEIVLKVLGLKMPIERLISEYVEQAVSPEERLVKPSAVADTASIVRYRLVAALLGSLRAVLLLDGLDEVSPETRSALEQSIELLGLHAQCPKIIVSCRSGDIPFLHRFSVVEICELAASQVKDVADRWLGNESHRFLAAIIRGSAPELAARPLFLCQMLTVFKTTGRIPDQPSTLCREMVRLVLQEWDHQRRFIRGSQYKDFDTDSKLEFLSKLAFLITFGLGTKHFEHHELVAAYKVLCPTFGLPEGESEKVAREIETHTGIIVALASDGYEFAHLSVQEFLTAEHLVRLPDPSVLNDLYRRNPDVMAVAIARSSEPSTFLALLVNEIADDTNKTLLPRFLTRVAQERPRFMPCVQLGLAFVNLASCVNSDHQTLLHEFATNKAIADSFMSLVNYAYTSKVTTTGDREYCVLPNYSAPGFHVAKVFRVSQTLYDILEDTGRQPSSTRPWNFLTSDVSESGTLLRDLV